MTRVLAGTLLLLLAIFALGVWGYAPPPARTAPSSSEAFSVARGRAVQAAIAGDGVPHPVGSEESARVRELLVVELRTMGWETEVQDSFACGPYGACAFVKNVIATREGTSPDAKAVLLMAHYDSVPTSPGASDDGFGVAALLETARALAAGPPLRRTVVVLLTDAEEAGVIGIQAFVREHPLAKRIGAAVSVDARGSAGPAAMFETGRGNRWIVGLLGQHVDHPVTSSLFSEVYRRMPQDTDFTYVKDGVHGVNFANFARIGSYHTPLDSVENADPATLQHHGDQVLAMARALASADSALDTPPNAADDAVWFDVFGRCLVHYPARWAIPAALTALLLVVAHAARLRVRGRGLASGVAALAAALVAAAAVGALLRAVGTIPASWIARPTVVLVVLQCACVAGGLAASVALARRANMAALWAGTWLAWAILGVITAIVAPGASHLFVLPTLASSLLAAFAGLARRRLELAAAGGAAVAGVLWLPLTSALADAVGLALPFLTAVPTMFVVSTLPALCATRGAQSEPTSARASKRWVMAAVAAMVAGVVGARLLPAFTKDHPRRVNVVVRQDEADTSGGARPSSRVFLVEGWNGKPWGDAPATMLGPLGEAGVVGAGRSEVDEESSPFVDRPPTALPTVAADVVSASVNEGRRHVRARLYSPRRAPKIELELPEGRHVDVVVKGTVVVPDDGVVRFWAVPAEGIEIELASDGALPLEVTIYDVSWESAAWRRGSVGADSATSLAAALVQARPSDTVPTQDGDTAITSRRLHL